MRTKGITLGWLVGAAARKAVGGAMTAAALLFAGCSSEDDTIAGEPKTTEPTAQTQATVIRVTVGAGISDGEGATRSTVVKDGSTRTLQFSAGDKLYVWRELAGDVTKHLAGELTMKDGSPTDGGTQASFEGELTVYDGTGAPVSYDFQGGNPLAGATATLLHAGMKETDAEGGDYSIDGATKALTFADATGVAATVEALMTKGLVVSGLYDAENDRFPLSATQPILNCTISGLEAGVSYKVDYIYGTTAAMSDHSRMLFSSMTATAGTLAFAFIAETGDKFHGIRLTNTAESTDTYDASIGRKEFESKVYNAARTAIGKKTPLTIEAITDGTIVVNKPKSGMQYRLNGGDKTPVTSEAITVQAGDKVQFYGNGTTITSYYGTYITGGSATVKVYGNIMSLVDEVGFATATELTETLAFAVLFMRSVTTTNDKLTDASGLLLPATTLTQYCYDGMFGNCTNLTAAPALPAKTLARNCYHQMFKGCTSLTAAPALDAETLAARCYEEMFQGCTSLTSVPAKLPATTLANYCYRQMFKDCTSLTTAPALPATTLVNYCYEEMFSGCSSLNAVTCLATNKSATDCTNYWLSGVAATGTFTKASTMTSWTTGVSSVPSGWTVVDAQ